MVILRREKISSSSVFKKMIMRTIFCIVFFILNNFCFSQKIMIHYDTKEYGDIYKSTLFYDSDKNISEYIDYKPEIIPETSYLNAKGELDGEKRIYQSRYIKMYGDSLVYSDSNIQYVRKRKLKDTISSKWTIDKSQSKRILGYECYKAEIYFRGRYYIAYYTPEIPYGIGPRKFGFTPGSILEIAEKTGIYEAKAVEIDKNAVFSLNLPENFNDAKDWNTLVEEAKHKYKSKMRAIGEQYNGSGRVSFDNVLEIYDLN